ncbi:hypothetical protein SUGI_0007470 [Cryptomeria japonica]|uniref:uncharacterized protein LOC131049025 n=1 Tax=Cryptomeria japonica TaxID=3369 RepID=UPI002408B429|nr:uncharacterized protein LOC131049025 [Cryptomeria japonica]GLJ04941.1 hypothetical protein SUGI_0007470 [Cryptomeria japonica]
MAEAPQLLVHPYNTTTDESIAESASTLENGKKQEEKTYDPHNLSASPSSDGNGLRPRIRYGKEELLNLRFVVSEEEQLRRWNEIMAALGPVKSEIREMNQSGQMSKDGRRQRARKKKQHTNKREIISEEENNKKQQEETYHPYHLSAFPSSDGNALRPRIKYGKEELLNLQFVVREEEQVRGCNGIMAALEPFGCDPCAIDKSGQMNTDSRRQRDCKKTEQENKTETISTGSVLLLKSEEECYKELPCSGLSGLKAAEFQKSSNCSYEENWDSESSEDEFDSLLKPALAVEGEPDFASGSPHDGFEYLRRVRWEANQYPRVKVANLDVKKLNEKQTPYMPNIPPVLDCSIDLLPSKDWEREFLADFSNLRMELSKIDLSKDLQLTCLPSRRDKVAWERFCFGAMCRLTDNEESCSQAGENEKGRDDVLEDLDEITEASQECQTNDTGNPCGKDLKVDCLGEKIYTSPTLSVILSLDEVMRATLFMYHVSWFEGISSLSKDRAVWLFALCAVLDKPLDAETCASVRSLLRKCASLRASKTKDDGELPMLNILITIAGKYFGQAEDLMSQTTACNQRQQL